MFKNLIFSCVPGIVVDPWNFGTDLDPALFTSGFQDINKK